MKAGLNELCWCLLRVSILSSSLFQVKLYFRVHRESDDLVKLQLSQWTGCRNGSLETCQLIGSSQGSDTWPPWEAGRRFGKREFFALEEQIWDTISGHLKNAVPSEKLPLENSVSCGRCELLKSERKVYSQHGVDGVLEEVFKCVGVTNKIYVEIGTQYGFQCSTRNLRVAHGFKGYMFDDGYEDDRIGLSINDSLEDESVFDFANQWTVFVGFS